MNRVLIDSDRLAINMAPLVGNDDRVLIADLWGSAEAEDNYTQINCEGLGRVRIFETYAFHADTNDPIENRRTRAFLCQRRITEERVRTQVFQLAGCTWRCWYCYVDEDRLSGNARLGRWLSSNELVELFAKELDPALVLDLSGGQPDLVPLWPVNILRALESHPVLSSVHVRSEDNLTGRLLTEALTIADVEFLSQSQNYTRIGCFKGFSEESFSFNTRALGSLYERQFACAKDILSAGISFFAHATFSFNTTQGLVGQMANFVDRLQEIHVNLPLRVVPLRITPASTWSARDTEQFQKIRETERDAVAAWTSEIISRFSPDLRSSDIRDISLA